MRCTKFSIRIDLFLSSKFGRGRDCPLPATTNRLGDSSDNLFFSFDKMLPYSIQCFYLLKKAFQDQKKAHLSKSNQFCRMLHPDIETLPAVADGGASLGFCLRSSVISTALICTGTAC